MDIFNTKRVAELEKEVRELKDKNEKLEAHLSSTNDHLSYILEQKASTPDGCIPGEYCRACEFVKPYYHHDYYTLIEGFLCGKGESCSNFIQKKVED